MIEILKLYRYIRTCLEVITGMDLSVRSDETDHGRKFRRSAVACCRNMLPCHGDKGKVRSGLLFNLLSGIIIFSETDSMASHEGEHRPSRRNMGRARL
jgi:hypothetical protein